MKREGVEMLDKLHICFVRNTLEEYSEEEFDNLQKELTASGKSIEDEFRKKIEPWLTAVFQAEHLSLLVGNGFTMGLSYLCNHTPASMDDMDVGGSYSEQVKTYAKKTAKEIGRGIPNIEDTIRTLQILKNGFDALQNEAATNEILEEVNKVLRTLIANISSTESGIYTAINECNICWREGRDDNCEDCHTKGIDTYRALISFLLSFASRVSSKDRLHIFTTNYDRTVEFGCDLAGIRVIDRFVGALNPVFRSSRLEIDYHYNPPGIRGEPRYLEGVIKYTKLHGSLDWKYEADGLIHRHAFPYGATPLSDNASSVMIYPNPAKDSETLDYPYAEMFRDFSVALCRPNSVLVTYGYGFGDDHINRIISDMLTITSTHLVIISFDDANGRIKNFLQKVNRNAQVSLLLGPHFGNIQTLTEHYLPKSAIDSITLKMNMLIKNRDINAGLDEDDDTLAFDSEEELGL